MAGHTAVALEVGGCHDWRERLALRVVACLADTTEHVDAIREILRAVVEETGVEFAGIRLQREGDFPFHFFHGLSEEFVRSESRLCTTNAAHGHGGGEAGPLDCLCGAVIRGRTEGGPASFTGHGSFFSGDLQGLAATLDRGAVEGFRGRCFSEGFQTHALLPLRSAGVPIGLLQLSDRRPNVLAAGDIEFLERLGASVAVVLHRQAADDQQRRLSRALRAVSECSQAAVRAGDELELLNEFCRILRETTGHCLVWVSMVAEGETEAVRPVVWSGEGAAFLSAPENRGELAAAAIPKGTYCVEDFASSGASPWAACALRHGFRSGLAVPLVNPAGAVFGALCILATQPGVFTPGEIGLIEELAGDFAFGVCSLRTRERQKRSEQISMARLRLLSFAADHSLDELLQETLDEAEALTGSRIGFYHFVEEDQQSLRLQNWSTRTKGEFCKALGKGLHYPVSEAGVWTDALRERAPVIHNDYATLAHRKGMPEGHAVLVRELVVPVMRGGRVTAVLGVGNKPQEYDAADVEAVALLADLAWDIAERMRVEESHRRIQEQLFQSQKMESIGTLAGGIAHDFNNLLGGVLVGLSLMELKIETRLGEQFEFQDDFQDMKAQIARGADLTKQLLGFARRGKVEVKAVDAGALLERTAELFGRTRKDVVVQFERSRTAGAVLADAAQIEQVVLNLLVNAGQAMPDGGTLTLRTAEVSLGAADVAAFGCAPGRYVRLSVSDTGTGMDAETRERVFEPFFTTKEVGEGSGLGLASAFGIVKSHGGFITVDSEPGEGSTFCVFLPACAEPVAEQKPVSPAAPRRGGETILVVDDEPQIVRALGQLLSAMGYEALTVRSGDEALEVFRQNRERVSLVILDMIMPGLSGSQTFDALRAIEPSVKVLLCSGYSLEGQATEILNRGCAGFLQKPFDGAALSAKLAEVL